ncbi:CPBP family intramembrane glutamic endopeptidase [Oceanobacillus alkalisoli]|uniref:CPBP family intramembrane glutamic endopeptidase n=1 Tax=Oceanobacillus alkalisoli TaxID=2925113 RepID=UPI001EEFA5FE|nr:type II CAAX endopeptidase family protein [Oceanobacillus alkalisoli]MCF3943167.1 CPBP family intramembrane metalloprotease [Oceanobacillus alkalisoli]MCG5105350.1 CPBP family intramembrane metalloprotease [Oceanobacillus alkalisoli]
MPKRYWYVIVTYLIMQFSALPVALYIELYFPESYSQYMIYWTIFSFTAGMLVTLWLMRPDMQKPAHRDASPASSVILWSILGVFLAFFAQGIAAMIEVFILGIPAGSENTMGIMEYARTNVLFILVPAIIAPILEEIIFRKIIFGSLYKRMNFFFAAILSALVFAAFHVDFSHLLMYTAMGLVFAFLYVKTKRIIVPIIVHAGMNSYVVYKQYNLTPEEIQKMLDQLEQLQTILFSCI